jgi:hypothetical protein
MRLSVPAETPRSPEDNLQTMPSVLPCLTIRVNSSYDGSSQPSQETTTSEKNDQFSGINVVNCLRSMSSVFIVHNSDSNTKPIQDQILEAHSQEISVQSDSVVDKKVGQTNEITSDNPDRISNNVKTENSIGNQLSNDSIHSIRSDYNQPVSLEESRATNESVLPSPRNLISGNVSASATTHEIREQRRRQRRERRQARTHHIHPITGEQRSGVEVLPDLLPSHLHPPPYTTLPINPLQPQEDCGYNITIPVIRRFVETKHLSFYSFYPSGTVSCQTKSSVNSENLSTVFFKPEFTRNLASN